MTGEELPPGTTLGGLVLGEVLGTGGSGSTVYAAVDPATGCPRAIKVLRGLAPAARGRLLREAAVAARVSHPGLVAVLDSGQDEDAVWLVLELVEGPDLQSAVDLHGRLDPPEALALLTQTGRALGALHAAGIVHRDLTPANLLVEGPLGARRARLTDSGLARTFAHGEEGEVGRLSAGTDWATSTVGGELVDVSGTAAWMPPEQWRGAEPSPAGDVYSAGAVLHWMLTGERPFRGATLPQLAAAHALGVRPIPSSVRAGLPPVYDTLVARLTAVEPSERPADGAALVALLEGVTYGDAVPPVAPPAAAPPTAAPPTAAPPAAATRRARRFLPVALVLGVVAVLAVTAAFLLDGGGDRTGGGPAAAPETREVCARELTVRDRPVQGSTTLATVARGGTVQVVSAEGPWSRVSRPDGVDAWVLSEFLCP